MSDDLIAEYETWLRSWGASQRTIETRTNLARGRIRAWGVEGLTTENIQEWLARPELTSNWSKATYHNHLTCFCSWLVATGRLAESPMDNVKKTRRPPSSPRPLAEHDVARVLSVVTGDVREWILLALLQGLRAGEIAKMHSEDVTVDGLYVEGKGGTKVTLPTHPDIWEIAQGKPGGYWFPGNDHGHIRPQHVSLVVGRLFTSLGIKGSIHRCRHVYGTRLLRAGVHVRTVQKLMRHANLDTTAAYTAVDEDELRNAIVLLKAS